MRSRGGSDLIILNNDTTIHPQHGNRSNRIDAVLNTIEIVGLALIGGDHNISLPGNAVREEANGNRIGELQNLPAGIPAKNLHQTLLRLVVRHSDSDAVPLDRHSLGFTRQLFAGQLIS